METIPSWAVIRSTLSNVCIDIILITTAAIGLGWVRMDDYVVFFLHVVFWPALFFLVLEGAVLLVMLAVRLWHATRGPANHT